MASKKKEKKDGGKPLSAYGMTDSPNTDRDKAGKTSYPAEPVSVYGKFPPPDPDNVADIISGISWLAKCGVTPEEYAHFYHIFEMGQQLTNRKDH